MYSTNSSISMTSVCFFFQCCAVFITQETTREMTRNSNCRAREFQENRTCWCLARITWEFKNNKTFYKIQRANKFLSIKIIRVFPQLTSTYNTVTTSQSTSKESKALISFLNKLGTETKLQSFNLKDILKGSWDFT